MRESGSTPAVRLDRAMMIRTAIFLLAFLWPLVAFERPQYISDSVSYLKGGRAVVEFAMSKVHTAPPKAVAAVSAAPAESDSPKAARSLTYSAVAYILRWPGISMVALVLFQVACSAYVCAAAATAMGVRKYRHLAITALALALATPLAIFSINAVPDIFAGIAVGCLILLFAAFDRLSTGVRLSFAALIAFAITSHASIPPLALGLVLVAVVGGFVLKQAGRAFPTRSLAWMIAPVVIGMVTTSMTNRVAFGDADLYAKRYPLALARSVADGPARWYLERHCGTAKYAVCEVFGTHYPTTVSGFVFDDTGLNYRATSEQMNRIRAEESEIVLRAVLAYPGVELGNLLDHVWRQLYRFGFSSSLFDSRLVTGPDGVPRLAPTGVDHRPLLATIEAASMVLVIACLILGVLLFRALDLAQRLALLLLPPALLGNSLIVVVFSGVADRYQARMIWLLPLIVLSAAFSLTERRTTAFRRQPVLAGR